ncbi:MAG: hypothetical protein IJX55_08985 [Clostridia bacterium]|nr:hypothetical protein [Clostridia bacterium]
MSNKNRENSERFLEELGNIDNKFLEEAMNYKKKKISVTKIVAAAACAALVIGTFPLINHFTSTPAGTGTTGGIIDAGTTSGTEDTLPTVIKLGESGEFTANYIGGHASDSNLNAEHSVEFSVGNFNNFVDESKANERKIIEINGRTWAGRYSFSVDSPYYGCDLDYYAGVNPLTWEKIFHIAYNRETGEMVGFSAVPECFPNIPETPITRDEAYEKAIEFLNNTISDMEDYELYYEGEDEFVNGYDFDFYKTINGIKTMEIISIEITGAGDVSRYSLRGYGATKNVDLSALDMVALNKVIEAKVNAIYKNNFDINSTFELRLDRLEDGTYYFYCTSRVTGRTTEDGELLKDTSFFAITLQ